MTDDYNPQRESKLMSMPVEIRRAIYASVIDDYHIHAFLSEGRIQLSACLQPNLGDHKHDGHDRKSENISWAEWARRLRSSWGPHWECEELALSKNGNLHEQYRNQFYHLLFLCKKMSYDFCDFLFERATINVTDLDTLDNLLRGSRDGGGGSNRSWNLWDGIRLRVRKLNVTFRLPLAFYSALDEDGFLETSHTHVVSKMCATWEHLWPAVFQLENLQTLCIWLDHDEESSWSVVKERSALQCIVVAHEEYMQSRYVDEKLPHIDTTLNLPKLHPRIAKPATHFVHQDLPPSFTIERRYRQRYHARKTARGFEDVIHQPDFPILYEVLQLGAPEDTVLTLQEIEENEKERWDRGEDVDRFLKAVEAAVSFPYGPGEPI